MATANAKPTPEGIVTRYRREIARGNGNSTPELEIRIQNVDYTNFAAIYTALLSKTESDGTKISVSDGTLTQMVGSIMSNGCAEGAQRYLRPSRIREIYFDKGVRRDERNVRKVPLGIPLRTPNNAGLSYTVALSSESADDGTFSSDEGAVIRIKARVSFLITISGSVDFQWRVDMTIVRQIMGAEAGVSLKTIIKQMFATKPEMSPKSFLKALRVDDANAGFRDTYRYEVEVEFVGPPEHRDAVRPADVTAAAAATLRLANPEYVREAVLQAEVFRIAQYFIKASGHLNRFQYELGLKRLLPSVMAITRTDYRVIYPPVGMFATEKTDGRRSVAVAHNGRAVIISDTLLDQFTPTPGLDLSDPKYVADTILDGELVEIGGKSTFYAFDAIAVAGKDLTSVGFEKRLAQLAEGVQILSDLGVAAESKTFVQLSSDAADLEREFTAVYDAVRPYGKDGIIITEPGSPYDSTSSYKWKPAEHNTIDMLARRAPPSVLGAAPFIDAPGCELYFLFVGISSELHESLGLQWCHGYSDLFGADRQRGGAAQRGGGAQRGAAAAEQNGPGNYFPIQFSPSDAPFAYLYQHPADSPHGEVDGKIIELRCAGGCAAAGGGTASATVNWEVTRIREDRHRELASKRYFGNDFHTAEIIWLNYIDTFPLNQLWDGPGTDYFMNPKSSAYRAQTAVMSFVKSNRIATLKHADWVVDIGAGKGQDLGRYLDAEVQHLVAVDQDRAALSELVRRKYSFAKRGSGGVKHKSAHQVHYGSNRNSTVVHILAANTNDPHASTLRKLDSLGLLRMSADAVVCNLAVHYFLSTPTSLRNFVSLIRGIVKIGGSVSITSLLGESVHALFVDNAVPEGGTWDVFESVTPEAPKNRKYSLKRLYGSASLEMTG